MKKIVLIITSFVALSCFILSCKNENLISENNKWVYADSANNANIKFTNCFAGNTPQLPTATANTGPQVFLYANGVKLTGAAVGYAGNFPSPNTYASIAQTGAVRFDVVMARLNFSVVPNLPAPITGDTLLTTTLTLDKGKYYTLLFGDSVGGPYKLQAIEDQFVKPSAGRYKLRGINWSMNPRDTFTIFSPRENKDIATNLTQKTLSNWFELDVPLIPDTLQFRVKGTTVGAATLAFTPTPTRMYSFILRGKTGVTNKGLSLGLITNY
jgi:hypothetical protein